MSFLGATLPGWRYYLEASFAEVGNYFLSLAVGFVLSILGAHFLLPRRGTRFLLVLASSLVSAGFVLLATASWLELPIARWPGLLCIGVGAGLLSTAMFQIITPAYRHNAERATNQAGVVFGLGCLLTALWMAGTESAFPISVGLTVLALLAVFAAVRFARAKITAAYEPASTGASRVWRESKSPGLVMFGLLVFFQFGSEWSIAGWLPLFLIRRLGISPRASLLILALYWTVLIGGRLVSQWMISRVSRTVLLAGSILSALLGTIVLASTNNRFGATMGVLFAAAGFAPVLPLVIRKIGHRFPQYHAGVFGGLFSLAMAGGLLAPWTASFFAEWRIEAVMILPMLGVCAVFVLTLLILLEAKLSGITAADGA